jgi:hypothetical protein
MDNRYFVCIEDKYIRMESLLFWVYRIHRAKIHNLKLLTDLMDSRYGGKYKSA